MVMILFSLKNRAFCEGFEAVAPFSSQNAVVFRPFGLMRFAYRKNFVKNQPSRNHAAAVALRDRFSLNYICHRRTSCPTHLKSLWLSLQLQFQHVHNKKSQLYWKFSQSRLLLNTKIIAGRGFGLACATLSHSELRRVS